MQPVVALIGDGKHDKNKDESANELEWEMAVGFSSMPRPGLEKTEAGSHFIEKAIS